MRILVTGGRGFIGSRILGILLQSSGTHALHILSRTSGPTQFGARVTVHVGDVTQPETITVACAAIDIVIHCVQFPGQPVENPRRGWTFRQVDGEGTRNLVEAARAVGVRRFIYISGAGVGPDRKEPWFQAKWMAEEAVRASGMEYVIFRPSLVYGPEDRSLNRFLTLLRHLPICPVFGDGRQHLQPIYVDELAALVAKAIALPEATNQIFEVGGAQEYTTDELLRELGTLLKRPRSLVHVPKTLLKWAAAGLQFLPNRPITPTAIDFLTMDVRIDPAKAREVFQWTPRPLQENLRRYI